MARPLVSWFTTSNATHPSLIRIRDQEIFLVLFLVTLRSLSVSYFRELRRLVENVGTISNPIFYWPPILRSLLIGTLNGLRIRKCRRPHSDFQCRLTSGQTNIRFRTHIQKTRVTCVSLTWAMSHCHFEKRREAASRFQILGGSTQREERKTYQPPQPQHFYPLLLLAS